LHTLSIVCLAKANGEVKKISVLSESGCFRKTSFDWAMNDSFRFFEECVKNELNNFDFYLLKWLNNLSD